VVNPTMYTTLLELLGGQRPAITAAFAIRNEQQLHRFNFAYSSAMARLEGSEYLFGKADWIDSTHRQKFMDHFKSSGGQHSWNSGKDYREYIVPLVHGSTEDSCWKISENGFAIINQVDEGFYGKGIYFTNSVQYADGYAKYTSKGGGRKAFLLSLVIPGNPYPVTEIPYFSTPKSPNPEGFLGKPVKNGYQSHYTLGKKLYAGVQTP